MNNITIKEIRKQVLKKTQQEMADFLGITRTAYNYKETGRRNFKAREIVEICRLANIPVKDLDI